MKYVKRRIPNNKGRKYINELTFFSILSLFNQNEISFKLTSTDLFFFTNIQEYLIFTDMGSKIQSTNCQSTLYLCI